MKRLLGAAGALLLLWSVTLAAQTAALFEEHFTDNRNGWPQVNDRRMALGVAQGDYQLLNRDQETHCVSMAVGLSADDDYEIKSVIDLDFTAGSGGVGLLFGSRDDLDCFVFCIDGYGKYAFGECRDGAWRLLKDWTASSALSRTSANRLKVRFVGKVATLFINDRRVATVKCREPQGGRVGYFLGPALISARVDDLVVRRLSSKPAARAGLPVILLARYGRIEQGDSEAGGVGDLFRRHCHDDYEVKVNPGERIRLTIRTADHRFTPQVRLDFPYAESDYYEFIVGEKQEVIMPATISPASTLRVRVMPSFSADPFVPEGDYFLQLEK